MHRLITDATPANQVDHINMDTLDNRRCNLRVANKALNMRNRRKPNRKGGSSSQYKGVSRTKQGKWHAYINVDGKRHNLGYFVDEKEAAAVYDKAALRFFGEYARLNTQALAAAGD